jgi:hypothetical protein
MQKAAEQEERGDNKKYYVKKEIKTRKAKVA